MPLSDQQKLPDAPDPAERFIIRKDSGVLIIPAGQPLPKITPPTPPTKK